MARFADLVAKYLEPRSYCAQCRRPFFTDRRFRCPCGETGRLFIRSLHDGIGVAAVAGKK